MTPTSFPATRPPCFASDQQWETYKRLSSSARSGADREGFTYCTDCTPEYQEKMKCQDRCRHPETTFTTVQGVVVGRRDSPMYTYMGITRPLHEWVGITGLKKHVIVGRLARGWSINRALSTPVQVQPRRPSI